MIIEIKKGTTPKEVKKALEKLPRKKKGGISKHFGTLKRGIDGLAYQKKIRSKWE